MMTSEQSTKVQTVLIADDDPDLVALVARRLERAGYAVVTATDGEQALRMARDLLPDLVVLDVMMPKLSGLDVTRRLREHPATRNILVMLISAGFGDNDITGLPAGADDYVKKPFGPQEVPNRVQAVLGR
jgi:DNA-binding response OmpR family regulator